MKLAVIFPGIGYHTDKPLLYYAKKWFRENRYQIREIFYTGFPKDVKGNDKKMEQAFYLAKEQTGKALADIDFGGYEKTVFVSKSIGTAVAADYDREHGVNAEHIYFTPVPQTFLFVREKSGMVFHGLDDPWCEAQIVYENCRRYGLERRTFPKANHSLETGNTFEDMKILQAVFECLREREMQELYRLIGLQPEIIRGLEETGMETEAEKQELQLARLLDRDTVRNAYEELKKRLENDPDNLKMLYCQLECARRVALKYEERDIPKKIFADTMKCFTRYIQECGEKNGRMYFDRGWWTYRQISMSLFRIGALEYEMVDFEGEKVISVHIPSDADMGKESVDESFSQAEKFFERYFGDYKFTKYICDSWLLAPALRQFLSEGSNILSFQNRFRILREKPADREFISWLFQAPETARTEDLPEHTRLQKSVKKLLLDGGSVGAAIGVMEVRSGEHE